MPSPTGQSGCGWPRPLRRSGPPRQVSGAIDRCVGVSNNVSNKRATPFEWQKREVHEARIRPPF